MNVEGATPVAGKHYVASYTLVSLISIHGPIV